jgi:hypothetical protein
MRNDSPGSVEGIDPIRESIQSIMDPSDDQEPAELIRHGRFKSFIKNICHEDED